MKEQGTSEKNIKPKLHPSGWWSAVSCPVPPQTSSGLLFQVKIKQDDTETVQDWHFPALCHVTLFEWISTFKNIQRKENEGCIKQKRCIRNKTLTRRKRATHVDTTKGKNIFKDTVTYPIHSHFIARLRWKILIILPVLFPCGFTQVVPTGPSQRLLMKPSVPTTAALPTTFKVQSPTAKGFSSVGRIMSWNYWKSSSEVWKIICSIFFPQLPRNSKQPAINLPLPSTQKHLQKACS